MALLERGKVSVLGERAERANRSASSTSAEQRKNSGVSGSGCQAGKQAGHWGSANISHSFPKSWISFRSKYLAQAGKEQGLEQQGGGEVGGCPQGGAVGSRAATLGAATLSLYPAHVSGPRRSLVGQVLVTLC